MHPRLLQENIVERVLRDRDGRPALVTFYVYESCGRMRARVLSVVYMEEKGAPERVLALSGSAQASQVQPVKSAGHAPVVSPYADSDLIYHFGSKPRAPASR